MSKVLLNVKTDKLIALGPALRPEVGKALKKASTDYEALKNISQKFVSISEAIKYLRSRISFFSKQHYS